MKTEKKKFNPGMNVGSSSILVTFVLLCLVTFAALSFVSARADRNLTMQTADRISSYYAADTNAEIMLANTDSQLKMLAKQTDKDEFYSEIDSLFNDNDMYIISGDENNKYISYSIPASDDLSLSVTLKAVYPESEDDSAFIITEWESISTYNPSEESLEEEKGGFLF